MAGYSGTPLPRKLGIRQGANIVLAGVPAKIDRELRQVVGEIQAPIGDPAKPLDFVLLFVKSKDDLERQVTKLAARLAPTGILWIAWPKKSSGINSDLSFNEVQSAGLALGMVDMKVCAVDETWSGLKFVIRLKDRPGQVQKMAKPYQAFGSRPSISVARGPQGFLFPASIVALRPAGDSVVRAAP